MYNVLQINILNETGSTGRIMQSISKVLENNEFKVYTAYGYGISSASNSFRIGGKLTYITHNIGSKLFCNQGTYSKKSTLKLIDFIKKKNIDIIHLHNIHGNYLNYEILFNYIKKNNIKVIWTLHDCWPFTGKCVHFDLCNCEKWKTECCDCPILNDYPTSYILDRSKQMYNHKKNVFTGVKNIYFVSPSNWLKNLFKQSFLKEYDIKVINNGIDLNVFKYTESDLREKYNLENKKVILGVASPWCSRKGLYDFNKLQELLTDEYKIVLIGVDKNIEKKINNKILGISKTDSVKELAEWYSCADVFVNPTYEDNYPTVNLEAIACNTPVITYNTGGSVEVINENTGMICPRADVIKLKEYIDIVIKNRSQFINCSLYAMKHFSEIEKYQEYLELYKKISTK